MKKIMREHGSDPKNEAALREAFANKLEPGAEMILLAWTLTRQASRLLWQSEERRSARGVSLTCMSRLIRDLLCTRMLGFEGYPYQAATIASATLEYAYAIGHIGDDDDLALEWIEHRDPTKAPASVWSMIKSASMRWRGQSDLPREIVDGRYQEYQQLCAMKHANPVFWGRQIGVGEDRFFGGPDFSDDSARSTQICFRFVSSGCAIAAGASAIALLGDEARRVLDPSFERLNELGRRWVEHAEAEGWHLDAGGVWQQKGLGRRQ